MRVNLLSVYFDTSQLKFNARVFKALMRFLPSGCELATFGRVVISTLIKRNLEHGRGKFYISLKWIISKILT
jgi:hypothetical protein